MMIKELIKNLFSKAETLSSEAEQNAKDYTDLSLTKRAWDVTPSSGFAFYNNAEVWNGLAVGHLRFRGNETASGWHHIGTVGDIPLGEVDIASPLINLSNASYFGELQVRRDGTLYAYYLGTAGGDIVATICYVVGGNT